MCSKARLPSKHEAQEKKEGGVTWRDPNSSMPFAKLAEPLAATSWQDLT